MTVDRSFIERNKTALEQLQALVMRLTDTDMATPLGEGWTVGSTLAHLAFWDTRTTVLLERWAQDGVADSPRDVDAINRAALPLWRTLNREQVTKLVIEASEACDEQIAATSDEIIAWCLSNPTPPINIERAKHRREHIAQIETAIKR